MKAEIKDVKLRKGDCRRIVEERKIELSSYLI